VSPVPDRPDPAAAAEGLVTRQAADPVLRVAVVKPELAVVRRDTAAERFRNDFRTFGRQYIDNKLDI